MKILIFTFLFLTFPLSANAQEPEPKVCLSQQAADSCRDALAQAPALRDSIEVLRSARAADQNVITAQKNLIDSYQSLKAENANEIKELRAMILELSKLTRPRKAKFCLAFCF